MSLTFHQRPSATESWAVDLGLCTDEHGLSIIELAFLIRACGFAFAKEWWPFLGFLGKEINMPGVWATACEKRLLAERSAWCSEFIQNSIRKYTSEVPFPDTPEVQEWMSRPNFVEKKVQAFVWSIPWGWMRDAYEDECTEEQNAVNTEAPAKKAENTTASGAVASKPKPPIVLLACEIYAKNTRPSEHIRFYYYSMPSLAKVLEDLRKRYELKAGDKITMLRADTAWGKMRVMVNEEQEVWDWEEAMEAVARTTNHAKIVFEVELE